MSEPFTDPHAILLAAATLAAAQYPIAVSEAPGIPGPQQVGRPTPVKLLVATLQEMADAGLIARNLLSQP